MIFFYKRFKKIGTHLEKLTKKKDMTQTLLEIKEDIYIW